MSSVFWVHTPDAMVAAIGDVEVAFRIEIDRVGASRLSLRRRTAITGVSLLSVSRDHRDYERVEAESVGSGVVRR